MMMSRLIPILFILAAAGLFFGYIQPTYTGSVAALQSEIDEIDTALSAAQQFKTKEVQLKAERESLSAEQLARLETFLPDNVDNVQLIVDLNSLAARSGVTLSQFDISEQEDTEGAQPAGDSGTALTLSSDMTDSIELSVSATGTYAAFRTFLAGIEKSLRPLDVVELTVGDSETGVYTYDLTLRLYWLR